MSDGTRIEWTDTTWNPVRGCSRVSEGCRNCYAERFAARFSGEEEGFESGGPQGWQPTKPEGRFHGFAEMTESGPRWTGKVELVDHKLREPLRWRRPRRVFVNSMSDLFHEKLRDEQLDEIFARMLACEVLDSPRHSFQILTKRPQRMRRYLTARSPSELVQAWAKAGDGRIILDNADVFFSEYVESHTSCDWREDGTAPHGTPPKPWKHLRKVWPLPNVWLGVSVEDQKSADERVPILLDTPAAVRFVSAEPLLGPVDLECGLAVAWQCSGCRAYFSGPLKKRCPKCDREGYWTGSHRFNSRTRQAGSGLDWVIVGGESGPGARPCDVAWIRAIVEQCRAAGVPAFVKQLGAEPVQFAVAAERRTDSGACTVRLRNRKGGDPAEWPEDLRVREFPEVSRP